MSRGEDLTLHTLTIGVIDYWRMIGQAVHGRPQEVCGLLGGRNDHARTLVPVENVSKSPTVRYQIDPQHFVSAYRDIEAAGDELVGIYHSHPNGDPVLSTTDITEATWPDVAYVIIGLRNPQHPQVSAWQIQGDQVSRVQLRVLDIHWEGIP